MKKLPLMLALLIVFGIAKAQLKPELGAVYTFQQSEILTVCNAEGTPISPASSDNIPSKTLFKVERLLVDDGGVVISILQWPVKYMTEGEENGPKKLIVKSNYKGNEELNTKFRATQGGATNKLYFLPSAKFQFTTKKEKRSTWKFATGSTIVKYRPGTSTKAGDIGNDFNVGLLAAISVKQDFEKEHSLLFGLGVGSVKVTPATTKNTITEDSNLASISPTLGYVFQVQGGQIGIMTGIDVLSGKSYRNWDYRGRPWIGFGIGFSLFKISTPKAPDTNGGG